MARMTWWFTPRSVTYEAEVRVFCNNSFVTDVPSSSTTRIRPRHGRFSYSYSHPVSGTTPTDTGTATGAMNNPTGRVEGTLEIFSYTTGLLQDCTSDGPVPYFATRCRPLHHRPPYIKPSLPGCVPEI